MTIKPVELCISISPHFKASRDLFSFVQMNQRTYLDSHKVMLYKKICFSAIGVDVILHCN